MTQVDIKALAKLARLEVSEDELARLGKEIPAIVAFVEQIQQVPADVMPESPTHHNVMRDDTNPHESGLYTKDLLDAAPLQRDNQVVVKQVIKRDKGRGTRDE